MDLTKDQLRNLAQMVETELRYLRLCGMDVAKNKGKYEAREAYLLELQKGLKWEIEQLREKGDEMKVITYIRTGWLDYNKYS